MLQGGGSLWLCRNETSGDEEDNRREGGGCREEQAETRRKIEGRTETVEDRSIRRTSTVAITSLLGSDCPQDA